MIPAHSSDRLPDKADRVHQVAVSAFVVHARTYVVVNAFLVGIWLLAGGAFWPAWVILGWGLGLVLHCLATFSRTSRLGQ